MRVSSYPDPRIHIRRELGTPERTVTEADIVNFASITWDHNQLHTDAEYAAGSIYGKRIAHGLLGVAIYTGLCSSLTENSLLALLELSWQFKMPLYIGDTIHVEQVVKKMQKDEQKGKGVLTFEKEVINQRGEVVQKGTVTLLLAMKLS